MTKNQRIWGAALVVLALAVAAIPTVMVLRYNKRLLPVLDLKFRLPQTYPQIPFSVTVVQDKISTTSTPELNEEQKIILADSLESLFHVDIDNQIYYSKYFNVIEFGNKKDLSAFVMVFSVEIPRVSISGDIKKITWTGPRRNFNIIPLKAILFEGGSMNFQGQADLNVRVFYSSSIKPSQPKKAEPETKKPLKPERF